MSAFRTPRFNASSPPYFNIPRTNPRHVACSSCHHRFYVPVVDKPLMITGTYIPLLLPCGHPICSECVKNKNKNCSSCNETIEDNDIKKLPLNLYTLGLIISSSKRPIEYDDQDFGFCDTLAQQLRQIRNHELCYECEGSASVKCAQCLALFCSTCYSKIHRKALQNHTQILLVRERDGNSYTITNNCSSACLEALSYFCNDCDVAGCSNCMLRKHKMHDYVTLQEKNEDMMTEFNEVSHKIVENLQRVAQTKQKLESTLISVDESEKCVDVETKITRHFTRLHGILQNMEAKLIDQLHNPRNNVKNNLKEIKMQLRKQEKQLTVALRLTAYTNENFNRVDMRNAIKVLSEMADLPCHLVHINSTQDEAILFDDKEEVLIELLKNYHVLQVPQMSHYELLRTEELPKNYEVDPLVEDPTIASVLNQTLSSKMIKSLSNISVTSNESTVAAGDAKPEKTPENKDDIATQVEVVHINDPSLFYVRYVASKAEYTQLEKDLRAYATTCDEKSSVKLQQNDMCIVKQVVNGSWYRGRVVDANNLGNSFETVYNIFYIDFGYKECSIPTSRIRSISDEHLKLQPQAIRCCLHGVLPVKSTWTVKSIRDFTKLLRQNSIFMHIMGYGQNILYVDICIASSEDNSMGPQSICNAMLFMKHAYNGSLVVQTNSSNTNVFTKEELALQRKTIVTISHIKSPAEIYVLKKGQWNKNFVKLLDDLKNYYENNTSEHIISTLVEGLPCVAQYTDGAWHRCEIVKVIEEDRAEVFFVDIGCTLTLDCDMLRAIPHRYTLLKAQAIKVSLRYVESDSDGTWKTESIDILSSIFDNKSSVTVIALQKTKDGYSCCINLIGVSDVSRLLKSRGVVKAWKFSRKSKKVVQHNIETESLGSSLKELSSEESDSDTKSIEEKTTKDPFKMEVLIKRVVTPDCIYVAQKDHEESNTNLIEAMQHFYNNYCSETRDNWSENALCAVYSAKDKAYFRARIVEMKSPAEVLVYFCDMGIVETVTMKDIQVLHQQFTKQPMHCFKVKLAGILPCGGSSAWPSLSISTLTDIIRENSRCKFFITKLDQQDPVCDNVIPVELWVRQTKIPGPLAPVKIEVNCINKMLVDEGVVLPIKDYFTKTFAVLATEFKQQLLSSQLVSCEEEDVQWLNKDTCRRVNCKIDDSLSSCEDDLLNQACNIGTSKEECDHPNRATDWLPPDEIEEEVFHALPTNVDNKGAVYLHSLNQSNHLINLIEDELQTHMASKKNKIYKKWKEEDICIAKYHKNNKWYRAKVLKVLQQANDEIKLHILFVDYGNEEECELEEVSRDIIMDHIPIQCTKCIISGLGPKTLSGNWTRTDLDRLHIILVDHKVKVCVLQRQPTHLIVSITLLQQRCDLLSLLSKCEMQIKIESKDWNNTINENTDSILDSTRNSSIEEITSNETADASKKSSLELETSNIMFKENVISSSFVEVIEYNNDKEIVDFESIPDIFPDHMISSTPQNKSPEESISGEYKSLSIPLDTKYIELMLCCNRNPTVSYAHLAENNDDMFSDILHDYYVQYKNIMSDIQENASVQPLIESFENNTSCIAKFTDDRWYRCVIMQNQEISDSPFMRVILHYIDYGNNEHKMLNLSAKNYDLHVPKKEWMELPAMAIECQLWNIDFISDDVDLLASKLDEIYNKVVVARVKEIKENILVAEIYKDKMCQELLYAHLVDEGLYRYKKPEED